MYLITTLGSAIGGAYKTDTSVVPVLLYYLDESLAVQNLTVYVVALYIESTVLCCRPPSRKGEKLGGLCSQAIILYSMQEPMVFMKWESPLLEFFD